MGEDLSFIFYQKYVGKKYNILTIKEHVGKNKHNQPMFLCECECGREKIVSLQSLTSGNTKSCGCLKSGKSKVRLGETYNYLTAIKELYKKDAHGMWLYLCLCICGKYIEATGYDLAHGRVKSCGCKHGCYKDLLGKKFGLLTPVKYLGKSKWADRSGLWLCLCDCGNYCEVTRHALENGTKSCGCLKMSYGEFVVKSILDSKNLKSIHDYIYDDCLSPNGYPCKFDFAILDSKNNVSFLIEYQGIQHFDESLGKFGQLEREFTDDIKKDYCKQNNIPLLEIRYDEDPQILIDSFISSLAS